MNMTFYEHDKGERVANLREGRHDAFQAKPSRFYQRVQGQPTNP